MLISRFICQTDLKPSSVTNGQNGTITPFSKCYNADRWVLCGMGGEGRGGIVPADLVLYLVILWMSLRDLEDVSAWGIVPCVSELSWCCTWGPCVCRCFGNHGMRIQD